MKKQILNIGKALCRAEQKEIFGCNLEEDGGGMACVQVGTLWAVVASGEHDDFCDNKKCVSSTGYGTWGLCKA